jgi:hypothetical protein
MTLHIERRSTAQSAKTTMGDEGTKLDSSSHGNNENSLFSRCLPILDRGKAPLENNGGFAEWQTLFGEQTDALGVRATRLIRRHGARHVEKGPHELALFPGP